MVKLGKFTIPLFADSFLPTKVRKSSFFRLIPELGNVIQSEAVRGKY